MVDGNHHIFTNDGHGLHGLRITLGTDEFLGRYCYHQPVLGSALGGRKHCDLAMGWVLCRSTDSKPILQSTLFVTIRNFRRGICASVGITP